jgi:hypothetical protein
LDLRAKKIILSGFEPKSVLTLLIPLPKHEDYDRIVVLNSTELRMTFESFSNLDSPIKESFFNGLQTAIIFTILYSLFLYFISRRNEKLNKKIEETNKRLENQEAECVVCKREAKETKSEALKSLRRIQIVLLSRISDYNKELSFWRDTIRKVLYQDNKSESFADAVIKNVSENLKTYSTLKGDFAHSFESAQTLADMINFREKNNKE